MSSAINLLSLEMDYQETTYVKIPFLLLHRHSNKIVFYPTKLYAQLLLFQQMKIVKIETVLSSTLVSYQDFPTNSTLPQVHQNLTFSKCYYPTGKQEKKRQVKSVFCESSKTILKLEFANQERKLCYQKHQPFLKVAELYRYPAFCIHGKPSYIVLQISISCF